jgi:hypothetical protein
LMDDDMFGHDIRSIPSLGLLVLLFSVILA